MPALRKYLLNESGYFGEFGGQFVPEIIIPVVQDLAETFYRVKDDENFLNELHSLYENFVGRPTPLTYLENISKKFGGAKIYLKNEGLAHTGAHKINHCIGQILLAKKMGKTRVIAETGAGQHGMATATVCAKMKMECVIYMGYKDYLRQRPNVFWMERLGAQVIPVKDGDQTLNSAVIAAFKDLMTNPLNTHYLIGTAVGPHPYPVMNTFFQKIIGEEIHRQILYRENKIPDYLIACTGGGSNAMGMFYRFLDFPDVELIAVEAGGEGIKKGKHAARLQEKKFGVFEGYKSYFIQDDDGNIAPTHSISAGMDYCGIGPQLAYLEKIERVKFTYATDENVLNAYKILASEEGIIPALESAHAFAEAFRLAPELNRKKIIVVNCSGRGEKDLFITMKNLQEESFYEYLSLQLEDRKKVYAD